MIDSVSPTTARKFWSGEASPRFLVCIDQFLGEHGFAFQAHNEEAPCSIWRKCLFSGYDLELIIWPKRERPGYFSFQSSLSISSERQRDVEIALGCVEQSSQHVVVLSVFMDWLAVKFGVAKSYRELIAASEGIALSLADVCAQAHASLMLDVSHAFESKFGDRESLAGLLMGLPDFLGERIRGSGPVSVDPLAFAAVLLADAGDLTRAAGLLNRALQEDSQHEERTQTLQKYLSWVTWR